MAFVTLSGNISVNLNQVTFFFGYYADTVLALDGTSYQIATFEGNDIIDLRRLTSASLVNVYSGSENDFVFGSDGVEKVRDGSGDDALALAGGNDRVEAGSGNDYYDGGAGRDTLSFEYLTQDGVLPKVDNTSAVKVDLAISAAQLISAHYGSDKILNFEDVVGGGGGDQIFGNAAANWLYGLLGDDVLVGRGGNDNLFGDDGKDVMTGGAGGDAIDCSKNFVLFDGARDIIRYTAVADSGTAAGTFDTITYFDKGGAATDDKIDLSALDGNIAVAGDQALTWRGNAGTFGVAAIGEVRWVQVGLNVSIYVDTDADAAAEMRIDVLNVIGLAAVDFIL